MAGVVVLFCLSLVLTACLGKALEEEQATVESNLPPLTITPQNPQQFQTKVGKGSLKGTYVGGSAEASLGAGLGANWLIGGSKRGFALQPWSVQASTGVNLTWAFSGLTLE